METIGNLIENPERLTKTSKEYTYAAEPTKNILTRMSPMVKGTWIDKWYDVFHALYLMIEDKPQPLIDKHVSAPYRYSRNFTKWNKTYDPAKSYASRYPDYAPNIPPTKL